MVGQQNNKLKINIKRKFMNIMRGFDNFYAKTGAGSGKCGQKMTT
jgi:hypothetical protein